jgi:hypothetical protein
VLAGRTREQLAQAPTDAGPRLRRLQSEMQMLLYTHPVNDARERAALAGQRVLGQRRGRTAAGRDAPARRAGLHPLRTPPARATGGLGSRLAGDRAGALAPLLQAVDGAQVQLTLCGPRGALTLQRPGLPHASLSFFRPLALVQPARAAMKMTSPRRPPRAAWALEQAGVHPLLARLYAARGVSADELDDGLARLLPPADLKGAPPPPRCWPTPSPQNKRLCIVADYDCDGATACAVAVRGLRLLGARHVDYLVPDRVVDGYGLTPPIAQRVARTRRRCADHRGQRHRQRRRRGPAPRRWACRCW